MPKAPPDLHHIYDGDHRLLLDSDSVWGPTFRCKKCVRWFGSFESCREHQAKCDNPNKNSGSAIVILVKRSGTKSQKKVCERLSSLARLEKQYDFQLLNEDTWKAFRKTVAFLLFGREEVLGYQFYTWESLNINGKMKWAYVSREIYVFKSQRRKGYGTMLLQES